MNTVMDDNKMLTLASNERIPLTPSMRLLLEINHMNHCSPATVSRGGVIYVNAEDVGWKPVVDSWIERLEASEYRWGVCASDIQLGPAVKSVQQQMAGVQSQ
jgi:dynein heavy chain